MATQTRMHSGEPTEKLAPESDVAAREGAGEGKGISLLRLYTTPGLDPFDAIEWELRDAVITNEKGEKVFEQKGVEVPKFWSQTATNVVASKYFRGTLGAKGREWSVRQLVGRVVDTITAWGR